MRPEDRKILTFQRGASETFYGVEYADATGRPGRAGGESHNGYVFANPGTPEDNERFVRQMMNTQFQVCPKLSPGDSGGPILISFDGGKKFALVGIVANQREVGGDCTSVVAISQFICDLQYAGVRFLQYVEYNPDTGEFNQVAPPALPGGMIGGGPTGSSPDPKVQTLADVGDLIKYADAFAKYGLAKTILKERLDAIIKLELSPGDPVREIDKSGKRIFNNASTDRKIFESTKMTDDQIIADLQYITNIGSAINPLIEKLKTLKTYIYPVPPATEQVSLTELEDVSSEIVKLVKEDKNNVNFNFTPLQYAVYVANRTVIEQLIKNNIPINLRETLTDPQPDRKQYTLEQLADKRDPKDPRKQDVVVLVNEIKKTRDKATTDYDQPTPQIDKRFLEKNKENEVVTLVYNKIYQESAQAKGGPSSDVIEIDQVRYADKIEQAKKNAREGKPDGELYRPIEWKAQSGMLRGASAAYTKYYDIERATMQGEEDGKIRPNNPSVEYNGTEYDDAPLQAVKDAYLKAFYKASATDFNRGFYDGLAAKPVSSYVQGLSFLEDAFITTLFESAASSISNIPTTGVPIIGSKGAKDTAVRDQYKQGYLKGIAQLITPNPPPKSSSGATIPSVGGGYYDTALESAKAAGIEDARNQPKGYKKYTTPARYYAADTRFDSTLVVRARKEIPIEIFLNKMITNYPEFALEPGATPTDIAEATNRQAKLNNLKIAYDDAYDKTLTKTVQGLQEPAGPPLKPATEAFVPGGTRKHKKMTPRRRSLRRK
jgi:hypothetical protein